MEYRLVLNINTISGFYKATRCIETPDPFPINYLPFYLYGKASNDFMGMAIDTVNTMCEIYSHKNKTTKMSGHLNAFFTFNIHFPGGVMHRFKIVSGIDNYDDIHHSLTEVENEIDHILDNGSPSRGMNNEISFTLEVSPTWYGTLISIFRGTFCSVTYKERIDRALNFRLMDEGFQLPSYIEMNSTTHELSNHDELAEVIRISEESIYSDIPNDELLNDNDSIESFADEEVANNEKQEVEDIWNVD